MKKMNADHISRLAEMCTGPDGRTYRSLSVPATLEASGLWEVSSRDIEILALENRIVPERYQRNIGTIGIDGQIKLLRSRTAVVGLGGLGGSVFEMLLRWGVGSLAVLDHDAFTDSNLNRQVLSTQNNLGTPKIEAAKLRAAEINSGIGLSAFALSADAENLSGVIRGCGAVVDALDNIHTRFTLEDACKKEGIPLVHGAIAGFMGQVSTIYPEDSGLEAIYGTRDVLETGAEKELGTPGVTPAAVAAWQAAEAVKILLGRDSTLRNKVLLFDLNDLLMTVVDLS